MAVETTPWDASDFLTSDEAIAAYLDAALEDGDVGVELRNISYDTDATIADLREVGHPNPNWFISKLRPAGA